MKPNFQPRRSQSHLPKHKVPTATITDTPSKTQRPAATITDIRSKTQTSNNYD